MSDIVERLRQAQDGYQDDFHWAFELMSEAAAEIERLRELKTPASRMLVNVTKALLDEANAENAKLLAALKWAANEVMKLAPNDGKGDATAFVQLAFDINAREGK